jgi:hypothetical protein
MADMQKPHSDPQFDAGVDVGVGLGRYDTYLEVKKAYEDGTLDYWLERERPKTPEEWAAWEAEHGPL